MAAILKISTLLILALLQVVRSDKMTVQVEPKSKECFYYDADAGQKLKLQTWVTRGGLLDVDLKITAPQNSQIFSGLVFESNTQEWTATQAGSYEFCFSNEMARWTPKIVGFELFVEGRSDQVPTDVVTQGTLDPINTALNQISDALDQVQKDQKYLRIREQRHRDTADNTNSRVLTFSVAESVVLLALSLGQVFYLRRFFDIKRQK